MKSSLLLLSIFAGNTALAADFTVRDPKEQFKDVLVPIQNVSCEKGPFGSAFLKVILVQPVGNSEQTGILQSKFMGSLGASACTKIVKKLAETTDASGSIQLQLKIIERSVLRLSPSNANKCEGAQQEIVTTNIENEIVSETSYETAGLLDCPSRDQTIYVLHENGIPTSPAF